MLNKKIALTLTVLGVWVALTSCGEYYQVQKSTDMNVKYAYAKKCYNLKKYMRAATLLEEVMPTLAGTEEGAQALYLLSDTYLQDKRYADAAASFMQYSKGYPKAAYVEDARFKAGKAYYLLSPDAKLDQTATVDAIRELQSYLDYYPSGKHKDEIQKMLFDLQDKLAYKELNAARLYYNLGLYMGNNYKSAEVTAKAALRDYPYTKYRDDLEFLVLKSKSEVAQNSVYEKKQARLRDVIDQYFNYINSFPEGKYLKEAKKIYETISMQLVEEKKAETDSETK